MTGADALARLRAAGVDLWLEGETLRYRAPAEALTAELDAQRTASATQIDHLTHQLDQAGADAAATREAGEQYRAEAEQAKVAAAELAGTLTALTAERDRLTTDLAAAQKQIGRLTK